MQAVLQQHSSPEPASQPDSFSVLPRNSDAAVVYWSLSDDHQPIHDGCRLSLLVESRESDLNETIILHRETGHFTVPLMASDRAFQFTLGWSDVNGFRSLRSQQVELPPSPSRSLGAMSTSLSFRGCHFWPRKSSPSDN